MESEIVAKDFYKKLGVKGLAAQLPKRRTLDISVVKKLCKKRDEILDLACGYGRIAIPLAKSGYHVTGVDLSPNLIKDARIRAKKQDLKIQFDIGTMTNLPHQNENFDKIVCLWSSFNHLLTKREQIKALNEMYRVLRKDGLAFVEMLNGETKKLKQTLKTEGQGPVKRLWGEVFNNVKNLDYIHDRKTLTDICRNSEFSKSKVGFKNMNGRRRLVMYLYK